jgi:hypothetical protein
MSDESITGGETVQRTVQLTDSDMQAVSFLRAAGLDDPHADESRIASALGRIAGETKGKRYRRWISTVRELAESGDHKALAAWQAANAPLVKSKLMSSSSVHNDATIANMSVQYGNDDYIGEQLMPPLPVPKRSDIFYIYDKRNRLASPDDEASDDSDINEINDSRSTDTYSCKMRALQQRVGATVIANQDAPLNELMDLTEAILDVRALKREIRIATVVQTSTNFASTNRVTIAAGDRWNSAGGGNPIKDLQDADALLWSGRGPSDKIAVCSLAVYNVLSRHPDILGLFQYNGSSPGLATPDMIARFFSWQKLLVGRCRKDTANEGAAASYSRVWGDFFSLLRVATRASIRNASFGYTFRWTMPGVQGSSGGIVTQQWFDPTKGLGGSYFAKVGEAEDHKVVANDCGVHITTPIS